MNVKKYIGRQLRPSQLAAELLPADQKWCALCHCAVPKDSFATHMQSAGHRLSGKKMNKLKTISLSMWEQHRGAPLHEDSAHEPTIAEEYTRFRQDQRRREQSSMEAWRASQRRGGQ